MDNEATINLEETIPIILTATDPITGKPLPNAVISDVVWNQDNAIGTIIPDPANPNIGRYKPSAAGVTHIYATAIITIR